MKERLKTTHPAHSVSVGYLSRPPPTMPDSIIRPAAPLAVRWLPRRRAAHAWSLCEPHAGVSISYSARPSLCLPLTSSKAASAAAPHARRERAMPWGRRPILRCSATRRRTQRGRGSASRTPPTSSTLAAATAAPSRTCRRPGRFTAPPRNSLASTTRGTWSTGLLRWTPNIAVCPCWQCLRNRAACAAALGCGAAAAAPALRNPALPDPLRGAVPTPLLHAKIPSKRRSPVSIRLSARCPERQCNEFEGGVMRPALHARGPPRWVCLRRRPPGTAAAVQLVMR
eukprot:366261-Chlamydomonas_euryale.AAC.2